MKTLIAVLLLVSSSAFAGEMKKIAMMAAESVEEYFNDGDHYYTINSQELKGPDENGQIAVETEVTVGDIHSGRLTNWTCTTQFMKTSESFEPSNTECKN